MIKNVGVVGCGFMGAGIVQVCAWSGYPVTAQEVSQDALKKGLGTIEGYLKRDVEKGKITEAQKSATMSRIKGTTNLNDLADSDIVIEVVPEDIQLKKKMFAELDRICHQDAILASNTSTIRIAELASVTKRPGQVIGTHFLAPVPLNKLMEIVRPETTSEATFKTVYEFIRSLGKEIVVAKDTPGFVFNYLLTAISTAAIELYEQGIATKEDIDKSMVLGLGHPLGPIALLDYIGLDVAYLLRKATYEQTGDPRYKPSALLTRMYKEGNLGRKTGKGFYDYTKGKQG